MKRLDSQKNPIISHWKALFEDAAARRKEGLFIVEGPKLCLEALSAGLKIREMVLSEGFSEPKLQSAAAKLGTAYELGPRAFSRISDTESPQGIFFVVEIPKPSAPAPGLAVALDAVQDPGNLGAILRSASAVGAEVILGKGCADPWSPKALRAAAGAQFRLKLESVAELPKALKAHKGNCWAMDSHGGQDLFETKFKDAPCLVVGSEGQGLAREVKEACQGSLKINYPGPIESLNAGVSLSVALFQAWRQLNQNK